MKNCLQLSDVVTPGALDIDGLFYGQKLATITFCNPYSFKVIERDSKYLENLSQIDYVLCDGILLVNYFNKHFKTNSFVRQSFDGNSLATPFFENCARFGRRVAIVGGVPGVSKAASKLLENEFGINVVFTASGFFSDLSAEVFTKLISTNADVLVVGMGAGNQERVLNSIIGLGWHGLGVTCGGYLDQVISGNSTKYYPEFINALHLRSAYRLLKEPTRMGRRYFIDYLPFYRKYIILFTGSLI